MNIKQRKELDKSHSTINLNKPHLKAELIQKAYNQLLDLKNYKQSDECSNREARLIDSLLDNFKDVFNFPYMWFTKKPSHIDQWYLAVDPFLSKWVKQELSTIFKDLEKVHSQLNFEKVDTRYSKIHIGTTILDAIAGAKDHTGIARDTGVSRQTLHRWLKADGQIPALISTVDKLAKFFNQELKVVDGVAKFAGPSSDGKPFISTYKRKLQRRSAALAVMDDVELARLKDKEVKAIADEEERVDVKNQEYLKRIKGCYIMENKAITYLSIQRKKGCKYCKGKGEVFSNDDDVNLSNEQLVFYVCKKCKGKGYKMERKVISLEQFKELKN